MKRSRKGANESPYGLRDHSKRPNRYTDYIVKEDSEANIPRVKKARVRSNNVSRPVKGRVRSSEEQLPHEPLRVERETTESSNSSNSTKARTPEKNAKFTPLTTSVTRRQHGTDAIKKVLTPPPTTRRSSIRTRTSQVEIPDNIRSNLLRLKNVLKLPKARRWVYCEFFYSGVDQQLFLGDSDFLAIRRDAFPNLRCKKLRRPEWRLVRRCIGKPRRFSKAFLAEERQSLDTKRDKIRQIYGGSVIDVSNDAMDLPVKLPRPLVVGVKIYARVREPKDGIYGGTIDAILTDSYRVIFDKEEMIPPMVIKDYEVMCEQKVELLPLAYFIEQNRACLPSTYVKFGVPAGHIPAGSKGVDSRYSLKLDMKLPPGRRAPINIRDERVGNYPVRMLVVLVKLSKLIDAKKKLVKQLTDLNNDAEKMNLLSNDYPLQFREKYAVVCLDLEALNKKMHAYLKAVQDYNTTLLPLLSDVSLTSRPEALRKMCHTHAVQIVKHCNLELVVQNRRSLNLATSLSSLLLQVRALCRQKCTQFDLQTLTETIRSICKHTYPANTASFQDYVEIHLKEIVSLILKNGRPENAPRRYN